MPSRQPRPLQGVMPSTVEKMTTEHKPNEVIQIAMELSAIAESGLAYCRDDFDIERFHRVGALANTLMQALSTAPLAQYQREIAATAGYTTPKIDVRAGIFNDHGQVLLAREIADNGLWTLPGGWCDVLETPREAVERESLEEVGVPVRATHLAAVIDRHQWPHEPVYDRHIYKLFFICQALKPVDLEFTSQETSQLGWFDVDDLPALSVARVLAQQIVLLHNHWQDPDIAYVD